MNSRIALCSMLSSLLLVAGCGKPEQTTTRGPVEVSVVTLAPQTVSITNELPGRTAAYRIAEVRPQVSGIVQKRLFQEGSEVKAGQQLLQIDAASYQANIGNAEAELARAQAQLTAAQLLAQRYESLIGKGVISRQDNDNAVAARAQRRRTSPRPGLASRARKSI